ncbi:hypothetical protein BJV82DRAFT_589525 [Fennellomyces sp. T-0311]|nr:hypothetical protein BJV82DRAFT_589525 [Fennellomyces sp. T-0311]
MENVTLTVRVGATLDTLQPIQINDDANPARILTDNFDGWVMVRVRNHPNTPYSDYFTNNNDLFCIQISGRFLQPFILDDLAFGNQFEQPLRLPWCSSALIKFAQWYDPGLSTNINVPRPYAFSPLIITMNQIRINTDPEWTSQIVEDVTMLSKDIKTRDDRRAFFKSPENRKAFRVASDQVWHMQFSNPYLDFTSGKIKLPGFEVDALKYWDGQPLRFYTQTSDQVLFIIELDLKRL